MARHLQPGDAIEAALEGAMRDAVEKRLSLVEVIPGKGSGQLETRALRFLARPDIKRLYARVERDNKNFGRVLVHFRHHR